VSRYRSLILLLLGITFVLPFDVPVTTQKGMHEFARDAQPRLPYAPETHHSITAVKEVLPVQRRSGEHSTGTQKIYRFAPLRTYTRAQRIVQLIEGLTSLFRVHLDRGPPGWL